MLDEVYNARVLAFAANIPRLGRLSGPRAATATAHSRLCGSTITVDLILNGDVVEDFGHEVRACVLGQASASILARNIVGTRADDLRALRDRVATMLTANGPPPEGRFDDLRCLEPVRSHRSRHPSTLLAFDAVVAALDKANPALHQSGIVDATLSQSSGVVGSVEVGNWRSRDKGETAC